MDDCGASVDERGRLIGDRTSLIDDCERLTNDCESLTLAAPEPLSHRRFFSPPLQGEGWVGMVLAYELRKGTYLECRVRVAPRKHDQRTPAITTQEKSRIPAAFSINEAKPNLYAALAKNPTGSGPGCTCLGPLLNLSPSS